VKFHFSAAQSVKDCIRENTADANDIAAIVIDSQIGGVAVSDENNESVAQLGSWRVPGAGRNNTFKLA
jgi:sugar (pentulose or hexulose) kinase